LCPVLQKCTLTCEPYEIAGKLNKIVLAVKWKLELNAEWDIKNSKTKLMKFIRNCDYDDAEPSKC
jgi:hypothetical protein